MTADALHAVFTKLSETTPRERAGLAALAAIGALTAAVYAMEWSSNAESLAITAAQTAADREATLALLQNGAHRRRLASESGNARTWSQSDDALAGESVLAELEMLCQQAGFAEPRIALVQQRAPQGQVSAIEASIAADFDWRSFLALLESLQRAELSIAVRSMDVTEEDGAQRMSLIVAVPVIAAEASR